MLLYLIKLNEGYYAGISPTARYVTVASPEDAVLLPAADAAEMILGHFQDASLVEVSFGEPVKPNFIPMWKAVSAVGEALRSQGKAANYETIVAALLQSGFGSEDHYMAQVDVAAAHILMEMEEDAT